MIRFTFCQDNVAATLRIDCRGAQGSRIVDWMILAVMKVIWLSGQEPLCSIPGAGGGEISLWDSLSR